MQSYCVVQELHMVVCHEALSKRIDMNFWAVCGIDFATALSWSVHLDFLNYALLGGVKSLDHTCADIILCVTES